MPELPTSAHGASAADVIRQCATAAGAILLERFRRPQEIGSKGRNNPVTETDLLAEKTIIGIITESFPDHAILAEETRSDTKSQGWMWVLDPLDGTRNFANGIPMFCTNIALVHNGVPQLGVTYDPVHGELFLGIRGGGATLNDEPLHVSEKRLAQSVIGVDLGYSDERAAASLNLLATLRPVTQTFRVLGSAALSLAYVAAGRHELYLHNYLFPWDFAVGQLLIEEAGGVTSDRIGEALTLEANSILAGAIGAHGELLDLIRDVPLE